VNRASVWTGRTADIKGEKFLVEPYIEHWQKWNSNTGWALRDDTWSDVMQALSHFSYHTLGGHLVLCDLQGGIYKDGAVISDPVILSRTRVYGPTDLGIDGILNFFESHQCSRFCRSSWSCPASHSSGDLPVQRGTLMEEPQHAQTMYGRKEMTKQIHYDAYDDSSDDDDYY